MTEGPKPPQEPTQREVHSAVALHLNRERPLWQQAFRRGRTSPDDVAARLVSRLAAREDLAVVRRQLAAIAEGMTLPVEDARAQVRAEVEAAHGGSDEVRPLPDLVAEAVQALKEGPTQAEKLRSYYRQKAQERSTPDNPVTPAMVEAEDEKRIREEANTIRLLRRVPTPEGGFRRVSGKEARAIVLEEPRYKFRGDFEGAMLAMSDAITKNNFEYASKILDAGYVWRQSSETNSQVIDRYVTMLLRTQLQTIVKNDDGQSFGNCITFFGGRLTSNDIPPEAKDSPAIKEAVANRAVAVVKGLNSYNAGDIARRLGSVESLGVLTGEELRENEAIRRLVAEGAVAVVKGLNPYNAGEIASRLESFSSLGILTREELRENEAIRRLVAEGAVAVVRGLNSYNAGDIASRLESVGLLGVTFDVAALGGFDLGKLREAASGGVYDAFMSLVTPVEVSDTRS